MIIKQSRKNTPLKIPTKLQKKGESEEKKREENNSNTRVYRVYIIMCVHPASRVKNFKIGVFSDVYGGKSFLSNFS